MRLINCQFYWYVCSTFDIHWTYRNNNHKMSLLYTCYIYMQDPPFTYTGHRNNKCLYERSVCFIRVPLPHVVYCVFSYVNCSLSRLIWSKGIHNICFKGASQIRKRYNTSTIWNQGLHLENTCLSTFVRTSFLNCSEFKRIHNI